MQIKPYSENNSSAISLLRVLSLSFNCTGLAWALNLVPCTQLSLTVVVLLWIILLCSTPLAHSAILCNTSFWYTPHRLSYFLTKAVTVIHWHCTEQLSLHSLCQHALESLTDWLTIPCVLCLYSCPPLFLAFEACTECLNPAKPGKFDDWTTDNQYCSTTSQSGKKQIKGRR